MLPPALSLERAEHTGFMERSIGWPFAQFAAPLLERPPGVREDWEYQRDHIANSRHTPLARILSKPRDAIQGDNLIFVCQVGQRSALAAEMAAAVGLTNLYNLEGGTDAWVKAGYPVDK